MSHSTRRHPNVINVAEADSFHRGKGERFSATVKQLAVPTGAQHLGCGVFEIPPGKTAMPRHWHSAVEEAVYVLEGRGTLRIGQETVAIGAGDYISFPCGPQHAHAILNTSDAPLRYLGLSTRSNVDVVGYPDSQKVLATGGPVGAKWTDPQWARVIVKLSSDVDYYEGEPVDEPVK